MSQNLQILKESRNGKTVFAFHGNIDGQAESLLKDLQTEVKGPSVSLDFGHAGRINSMGIALLLRCLKSMKEKGCGDIRLQGMNATTTMLFRMTGVFLLGQPEA